MDSKSIVSDVDIACSLNRNGWGDTTIGEGRLMILELLSKTAAGYYNSCSESGFLSYFGLLKKDRTPNRKGRKFICEMVYASSNKKPDSYELMKKYRK